MRQQRRRSAFPLGCLVALCVLAFAIGAAIAVARRDAQAGPLSAIFGPRLPKWTRNEPVTLLLLGTDKRDGEEGPSRSDTIMLAMFDPEVKSVSLLSIPRDLIVNVPGYGEGRINTAFFRGQAYDVAAGGPGLAALTITYNFGVPVDYWATVDFQGFERIIDALGGVTVDVPDEIVDYEYPDANYGTMTVRFEPGEQNLNGERALQYARTRHGSSDFERARRQQQIIRAALSKALSPQALPRLPRLVPALSDAIETNADPDMALALAGLAREMQDLALDNRVLDEKLAPDYVTDTGAYVLLPDWPGISALVRELFGPRLGEGQPLANVGMRVENATALGGLAGQTASFLQNQGAVITAYGDRDEGALDRSRLYVYSPAPVAVRYLMDLYHLEDGQVVSAEGGPPQTHLTLVLGWDVISGE